MSGIKKGAGSRYGYPNTIPANAQEGFHPRRCGSPECDSPRTGTTSSSLFSAGTVWGDRHCPLLRCTSTLSFISKVKGILQILNRYIISFIAALSHSLLPARDDITLVHQRQGICEGYRITSTSFFCGNDHGYHEKVF
jgi:hypothetical protein